jgi:hypothetical protein
MNQTIRNFVVIESIHGPFLINRHRDLQADALIKTGRPHIQRELDTIMHVIDQLPDGAIAVDGGANAGLVRADCAPAARARRPGVRLRAAAHALSCAGRHHRAQ